MCWQCRRWIDLEHVGDSRVDRVKPAIGCAISYALYGAAYVVVELKEDCRYSYGGRIYARDVVDFRCG